MPLQCQANRENDHFSLSSFLLCAALGAEFCSGLQRRAALDALLRFLFGAASGAETRSGRQRLPACDAANRRRFCLSRSGLYGSSLGLHSAVHDLAHHCGRTHSGTKACRAVLVVGSITHGGCRLELGVLVQIAHDAHGSALVHRLLNFFGQGDILDHERGQLDADGSQTGGEGLQRVLTQLIIVGDEGQGLAILKPEYFLSLAHMIEKEKTDNR